MSAAESQWPAWLRRRTGVEFLGPPNLFFARLTIALSLGAILYVGAWNAAKYPISLGYDAQPNAAYIHILLDQHHIPRPDQSGEANQPPAYYLVAGVAARLGHKIFHWTDTETYPGFPEGVVPRCAVPERAARLPHRALRPLARARRRAEQAVGVGGEPRVLRLLACRLEDRGDAASREPQHAHVCCRSRRDNAHAGAALVLASAPWTARYRRSASVWRRGQRCTSPFWRSSRAPLRRLICARDSRPRPLAESRDCLRCDDRPGDALDWLSRDRRSPRAAERHKPSLACCSPPGHALAE